jgi:hypothetical protein
MANRINGRPWTVQARRNGPWRAIDGESYARREQADHRRQVYSSLIKDAHFRVVKITDLPRDTDN